MFIIRRNTVAVVTLAALGLSLAACGSIPRTSPTPPPPVSAPN